MLLVDERLYEREYVARAVYVPDPGYTTFVAKVQKARTRKDKDYFVFRVTVPKAVANKIDAEPGDFLFFKTKKAEWYHMLDWSKMETTWQLLSEGIRNQVVVEGLPYPGADLQMQTISRQISGTIGNTSPSASPPQVEPITSIQTEQG